MATFQFDLPDDLAAKLDQRMHERSLGSPAEYFRSVVAADLDEINPELEQMLLDGLDSGPGVIVDEAFWSDLRQKTRDAVQKARR